MTAIGEERLNPGAEAAEMEALFDRLFPLMRSITGAGVRQTGAILSDTIPLDTIEIPSGTVVFDWTVPPEWIFRDAYVIGPDGKKRLDARANTLRVLNYSAPFRGVLTREELDTHLYSQADEPDAIPYLTSYYRREWGFCLSQREREALPEGDYEVVVDTEFDETGSMTLFESVLPGESKQEILISVNICHPSLANNELSGPLIAALLHRRIANWASRRCTFRFLFVPETIGAIAYLAQNGERLRETLTGGYVLTCVGDNGPINYKCSRRGDSDADRAARLVLGDFASPSASISDYTPWGSDERQYCSPGFDLPMGTLMRGIPGIFPGYHTSLDNKSAIDFDAMVTTLDVAEQMCRALDGNVTYLNLKPNGEPKLDKSGLYPTTGGLIAQPDWLVALRWILNLSDGTHDILAIAERSKMSPQLLCEVAGQAEEAGILEIQA